MNKNDEKKETLRKTLLGLTFPLAVAISANAIHSHSIEHAKPTSKELECIKAEMRYSLDIFNVNMNYTMKRWECQAPLPLWHALYDEEHENLKFKRLTS